MSTTAAPPVYRPSPIKRPRRTKSEIEDFKAAIYAVLEQNQPMTVRGVFYRMVSEFAGLIEKSEKGYRAVQHRLVEMRLAGEVPFGWIADSTRWQRKPRTHSSLVNCLEDTAQFYRRALWNDQSAYVEVWLEKDALSGVVLDVTAKYDVPLMVTRGYSSLSFLFSAAMAFREIEKPIHLYYLGDHDPSGRDIPRATEERLREFAPDADIHFECIAVTERQIEVFDLPTRPTKTTDTRAKNWEGGSVEVDALPPAELRDIVRRRIEWHIDPDALHHTRLVEEHERSLVMGFVEQLGGAA